MKTNYHTHTDFCDGKRTAEEMVLDAINCGFDILGFSSHAAFPFESDWHLKLCDYSKYCSKINELKQKYKEKIEILLGFEADFFPFLMLPNKNRFEKYNLDFLIGSVHYVLNLDKTDFSILNENSDLSSFTFSIDGSEKEVFDGIQTFFYGDGKKASQNYFSLQREMIKSCDFDIIGHPDILRKRNSSLKFFDSSSDWYKKEILETVKVIAQSNKIVEINYGGIPRGSIDDTYPEIEFLKLLNKFDVPVTISSDAHDIGQFNIGYDYALKQAKTAGFNEIHYLTSGLWKTYRI